MKEGNKNYIIIGAVVVLLIVSVIFTLRSRHKNRDVLKDAEVEVQITDTNPTETNKEYDRPLDVIEQEAYIANEHSTSNVAYVDDGRIVPDDELLEKVPDDNQETDNTEPTSDNDTQQEEPVTTDDGQQYVFSYSSIDNTNYVNFTEQLCSVNFTNPNVDIFNIPLGDNLREQLNARGCVNKDALTYSFITTDNGFNDSNNSFYLIIHIPNESKDYVLLEGVIADGVLDRLDVTVMR